MRKKKEVFIKYEQFRELLKSSTIVIHSAIPDNYVDILCNFSDTQKTLLDGFINEIIK